MAVAKTINVGVIVNRTKPGAREVLNKLIEFSRGHPSIQLHFEKRTGAMIRRPGISEPALAKKSDLLLVAGGDGSLLDVVESVFPSHGPPYSSLPQSQASWQTSTPPSTSAGGRHFQQATGRRCSSWVCASSSFCRLQPFTFHWQSGPSEAL